ncbi:MAG TPA: hypothetical protein DCP31_17640, partial [Cyanobacteria bacterium UBA8543]|nr:hypothetical protein [Cyanobacteria bacterium UBA8543]
GDKGDKEAVVFPGFCSTMPIISNTIFNTGIIADSPPPKMKIAFLPLLPTPHSLLPIFIGGTGINVFR